MDDETPSLGRIGRYELLARLGVGGMGEVFHARATGAAGFEKQVVIKRILPHLAQDPLFVKRFVAEGKLVVHLEHASIAQVYDLGEEEGVPYLAMEFVDGRDLRELMKLARAGERSPSDEIRTHILVGILEALDYAHRVTDTQGRPLGIIHRDVSPANVMVSRGGEVKLVDFGIARAAARGDLSLPGALQGKYAYMSPEQAAGAELDGRSDLFSVGVLAWELFTGSRPFDGETDLATLDRIRSHDPGSLADVTEDAPPEVVDVVDRLLAKSPDERPETGAEAIRTLKGLFLRRGVLVGSREVAVWVDSVFETLPESMRNQPAAGLSLDEALQLPMDGGEPGASEPPKTATVSMIDGSLQALSVPELSTVAPTKAGRTPTASELGAFPPTIGPSRRRGRLVGLLVSLNLLLLASVAVLVWQQSGEPLKEAVDSPPSAAPPPTASTAATEPALSPAPTSAPSPAAAKAPTPSAAPASAQRDRPSPTTPRVAPAPDGRTASPDRRSPPSQRLRNAPPPKAALGPSGGRGRVVFRFYPASSKVVLDGRALSTGSSNVVNRELDVGKHRLLLIGPDGVQRSETFEVKAGKTTNLTTLHVTAR